MRKFMGKRGAAGASPGSLVYLGKKFADQPSIRVIHYGPETIEESTPESPEEFFEYRDRMGVTWVNIDGLEHVDWIEQIGEHYNIHPLTQEDILNTHQRPKIEQFENYLYFVLRVLSGPDVQEDRQVSLLLGPDFVFSFQERRDEVFDPVRERIRSGRLRIRNHGADYLAYALIDTIVDNYFIGLETIGDRIEAVSGKVILETRQNVLPEIFDLRTTLIMIRKAIWPFREVLGRLERLETNLIQEETLVYVRDVYDHTVQVIDTVETFRDMSAGLIDLYLSTVNHRMNEVMKVLTVMASLFIPLTFIAGVYGMNFDYMPETRWRFGYYTVIGFMLLLGVVMLAIFRRKKWI